MAQGEQEPQPLSQAIERATKAFISIAAVLYGLGFLIVNAHLAHYGVSTTEFARSEYVLAGALYFALSIAAYLTLLLGARESMRVYRNARESNLGRTLAIVGAIIAFALALLPFAGSFIIISVFRLTLIDWKTYAAFVILAGTWSPVLVHPARLLATGQGQLLVTHFDLASARNVLLELPLLLVSIGLYATVVYPEISASYGGGHPRFVNLVMTPRGSEIAATMKLGINPDGKFVGPVQVLFESQGSIALVLSDKWNDHRAVQISRAFVEAIASAPGPSRFPSTK